MTFKDLDKNKIQFHIESAFTAEVFEEDIKKYFSDLAHEMYHITKGVGTKNNDFQKQYASFLKRILEEKNISQNLKCKYDLRLYAYLLMNDGKAHDDAINKVILQKIDQITDRPSFLLIEALSDYFFVNFKDNAFFEYLGLWIFKAREKRRISIAEHKDILSTTGPQYLAQKAFSEHRDLAFIIQNLNLEQYKGSKYLETTQGYYYLETLKHIPTDQNHHILNEVQESSVYNAAFENNLLGHKILEILIERSPKNKIHQKWREVILKIAGDPRVPKNNKRFLDWWQYIDTALIAKVKGWFSTFDIHLFLQAMEDYTKASYNDEMQRMFPSRKKFLEGLLEKELVVDTRLFLSKDMEKYLKMRFKKDELPNYSIVSDTDKSLIYIDLEKAKMIEGSHTCYLWVYSKILKTSDIYDLNRKSFSYHDLTAGLNYQQRALENITHNPNGFSWQKKAIQTLQSRKIDIDIKDVLTPTDWREYRNKYGVY